ncbi:unannotated protein [freshwater metagenome]|uniref:Unannotated protein n=1 Tax=freshwater metagenome TaxID=449393 RepID=A0A6J6KHN0_9ZZZZ
MASGVTQVHQSTFTQHQNAAAIGKLPFVNLWLDFNTRRTSEAFECGHVDFIVEVTDVGNDRLVLQGQEVVNRDDIDISRRGNQNVDLVDDALELRNLIPIHRGLEGQDGVNLRDDDASALTSQGFARAFAHITITADKGDLAAHESVGGTVQAINQ